MSVVAAVSALLLAPLAGVLLWMLVLRHVALAPGAEAARIVTPSDAVPVLAWARRLEAPGPLRREAAWRGLIEMGAVAAAVWALAALGGREPSLVWPSAALGWLLLAASAIDARERLLPDEINLAIFVLGVAQAAALSGGRALFDSVVGALLGYGVFAGFGALYTKLRGRTGLGLGDAKLLGALGAWTGWQGLPSIVTVAAGSALLWVVTDGLLRRRPLRMEASLPLGPFLALSGWLVWLYGPIGM